MSDRVQGAASFSKNIAVLQEVCDASSPPTISELMEKLNMPRPTLYRMLAALEAERFIEQDTLKRWQIGPRAMQLAANAWKNNDLRKISRPFLEQLRDQTGETIHLAIRNGFEMIYIDKVESREAVRMASTIGARVPFHSTSVGKAFLFALDENERSEILDQIPFTKITEYSVSSKSALGKQLHSFTESNFIIEHEENEIGVACYGEAILNNNAFPIGAVSVSIPIYRMNEDHTFYTDALHNICQSITKNLPPF